MTEETGDLTAAMRDGDVLAEAERRYEIVANMLDPKRELRENERGLTGTEVKALSLEADRLMLKIVALRAEKKAAAEATAEAESEAGDGAKYGKVVEFDAARFRKSG